jgi:hypothetical protein
MVNIRLVGIVLTLALSASVGAEETLSYEEYQKAIGAGQERLDYSKRLIGHDKLHTLVPAGSDNSTREVRTPPPVGAGDKSETSGEGEGEGSARDGSNPEALPEVSGTEAEAASEPKEKPQPVASPERASEASKPDVQPQVSVAPSAAKQQRSTATRYISPSLRSAGGRGQRNQARVERSNRNRVTFGISLGTEITVSLDNSASNIQPGLIKLTVEETVRGRKDDLPRGSTLFARSSAVLGSERLFLNVSQGVTPNGDEFSVQGVVFDTKREPGLAGRVISDGKTLARASSEGLNTLGRELLGAAPTTGATGAATEATLKQLLKEKQSEDRAEQGRPAYVVIASPQAATVQIETTF